MIPTSRISIRVESGRSANVSSGTENDVPMIVVLKPSRRHDAASMVVLVGAVVLQTSNV